MEIKTNLFKRQENALTNFNDKSQSLQTDLLKHIENSYLFDFFEPWKKCA